MPFPSRDLTNQYISLSYQDVVQRYTTGTASYFLDGTGNEIGYIPTTSLGKQILTVDQTVASASYALRASISETSSLALVSIFSDTASIASYADFAGSASWAPSSPSISSSHANQSDFAITASYAYTSSFELMIELSSSWASQSLSASYSDTASYVNAAAFDNLVLAFEFKFTTNTSTSDPGNGKFKYNSAASGSITQLNVSSLTNNGLDITSIINSLQSGSYQIYIQQKSDSTKGSIFQVVGTVINNSGWFTVPISHLSTAAGGLPSNNQICALFVINKTSVVPGATYPITASWALTSSALLGYPSGSIVYQNESSVALGTNATATFESFAVGPNARALAYGGIALADTATAFSSWSIAIGYGASATGIESLALGADCVTSGQKAVALGGGAIASAANTVAIGDSGANAVFAGSMVVSLIDSNYIEDTNPNQFRAFFAGGYFFEGSPLYGDGSGLSNVLTAQTASYMENGLGANIAFVVDDIVLSTVAGDVQTLSAGNILISADGGTGINITAANGAVDITALGGAINLSGGVVGDSFTGPLFGTASWANNTRTASISLNSSFASASAYSTQSLFATQSINATSSITSKFSTQSLFATQSLNSTSSITSIFATQSLNATNSLTAIAATSSLNSQTSSISVNSLFASSSAYSTQSLFATQSKFATQSLFTTQSLFATSSLTASFVTASNVKGTVLSASWSPKQLPDITNNGGGVVGINDVAPPFALSISGTFGPASTVIRGDGSHGGIDFFNNGIGYYYAAKIYTFKAPDYSEYYGFTNDYDGVSAQLSLIANGAGIGNMGFYVGDGSTKAITINSDGNVDFNQSIGNSSTSDYFISVGGADSFINANGGNLGVGTTDTGDLEAGGLVVGGGSGGRHLVMYDIETARWALANGGYALHFQNDNGGWHDVLTLNQDQSAVFQGTINTDRIYTAGDSLTIGQNQNDSCTIVFDVASENISVNSAGGQFDVTCLSLFEQTSTFGDGIIVSNKAYVTGSITSSLAIQTGGFRTAIRMVTGSLTLKNTDYTVLCTGSFNLFLPSTPPDGTTYVIKKLGSTGTLVITGSGTIDGASSNSLTTQNASLTVQAFSQNWYII